MAIPVWLSNTGQDVRYAARALRRHPAFAIAAAATLSIAIGANSVMFSVVNAVLLQPLPYSGAERLVMLWTEDPAQNLREGRSALPDIEQWRSHSRSFEDMAIFDAVSTTLVGADGAEQITGALISANLLPLLGVQPLLGRTLTVEDVEQRQRVVLISHRFWQTRFGRSPDAIGQIVVLDGSPSRIVGVLPADFPVGTVNADVWQAQPLSGDTSAAGATWFVVGRLRAGITLAQAQSEMSTIAARLNESRPAVERSRGISVVPLTDRVVVPQSRLALWMLGGAVLLVFLVAAANVASLTLARSAGRVREIAVRIALGAGTHRIVGQLLTESLLLGVVSGALGTLLAWVGIRLVRAFGPGNLARLNEVTLDFRVVGWAFGLALVGGMLVGLAPATLGFVRNVAATRDAGGRGFSSGRSTRRIRRGLVVAEFALTIIVLAGAALLVRSWWNATNVDPGFAAERVLVMELSTPSSLNAPAQRTLLYESVLEQIQAVPGVESAGIVGDLFIANSSERIVTVERDDGTASERLRLRRDEVSADFFKTLGTPLLAGHSVTTGDRPSAPAVAVINSAMARRLWPSAEAVGRRFKLGAADSEGPWYTVVGVAGDMRRRGPELEPLPQMFEPLAQNPPRSVDLVIRTSMVDPLAMAATLRSAVRRVATDAPLYGVASLEDQLGAYLVRRRFESALLAGFSLIAVLLAAVGIYGLLQYSVVTRTHEIGIRMAVGARAGDIFRMVVAEGLTLSLIGITLGLIGAVWLSHAAANVLFGVAAGDTLTFTAVSSVLTVIALVACYFPARRATRIDPRVCLHLAE